MMLQANTEPKDVEMTNIIANIQLTNITGTRLENLNEDCLLKVFEDKSMGLMELCSLAETCKRFLPITRRIFPKEFEVVQEYGGHCMIQRFVRSASFIKYDQNDTYNEQDIQRFFKNFGSSWTALDISQEDGSNFLINLTMEHCIGNLKRLKIRGHSTMRPAVINEKFKPILQQLKTLDLRCVYIEDRTVLAELNDLVALRIEFKDRGILENIFLKLEQFAYKMSPYERLIDPHHLSTFISRHTILKTIDFEFYGTSDVCSKIVLQAIAESCNELEYLRVFFGTVSVAAFEPLQSIKSLRTLELVGVSFEGIAELLSTLTNLRELSLQWCHLSNNLRQFDSVAQLTRLNVGNCKINQKDLVDIIKRLENLEELTIYENFTETSFELDLRMFFNIKGIVKHRENVLTLTCKYDFELKFCEEKNQKVKLVPLRH